MFTVYVIRSQSTGKIYIGQTLDLTKRLARHNGFLPVKKTSFTARNKGPWMIVYKKNYDSRKEALKREKYLKSHHGRNYLKELLGR